MEKHSDSIIKSGGLFFGIPQSADWESVVPVEKGWSSDRKYLVSTRSGERLLLRLSAPDKYEEKKKEFGIVSLYAKTGISMSRPVGFGVCGGGNVYMLLTWLDGRDLEDVLPELSRREQYLLGREAGEILRRIHSIPLAPEDIPQGTKREKKLLQLSRYEESSVRCPGDEEAIRFVRENIGSIWTVPPVCQHGDFHPGNLIISEDGSIGVIDFNRWEIGDPYEEFYKLQSFGREISVPYCTGQIDAYFKGRPPDKFWAALKVYVAHASLYSIKWAEKFGQPEIDGMTVRCRTAFEDYESFTLDVPKWYEKKASFVRGPVGND